MRSIERILVASDFSECAAAAAEVAARWARQVGATVHVMTMVDTSAAMDAPGDPESRRLRVERMHEQARQNLETFTDQHFAKLKGVQIHVVDGGMSPDVSRDIVRTGEEHRCDLIVVGTHGRTGFEHFVLGSVAEKLVRTSPIPVLTVRRP